MQIVNFHLPFGVYIHKIRTFLPQEIQSSMWDRYMQGPQIFPRKFVHIPQKCIPLRNCKENPNSQQMRLVRVTFLQLCLNIKRNGGENGYMKQLFLSACIIICRLWLATITTPDVQCPISRFSTFQRFQSLPYLT